MTWQFRIHRVEGTEAIAARWTIAAGGSVMEGVSGGYLLGNADALADHVVNLYDDRPHQC